MVTLEEACKIAYEDRLKGMKIKRIKDTGDNGSTNPCESALTTLICTTGGVICGTPIAETYMKRQKTAAYLDYEECFMQLL